MPSVITIVLSVPVSGPTANGWLRLVPGRSPESFDRLSSYLAGIAGGPLSGSAVVTVTGSAPVTIFNGYHP